MRIILFVMLPFMLAACGATGPTARNVSVEITRYGIIETEPREDFGLRVSSVDETEVVPYLPGTRFGIVYRVDGEPIGAPVQLKLQSAVRPKSQYSNKIARLRGFPPRHITHTTGEVQSFIAPVDDFRDMRRPAEVLMMIVDLQENVLALQRFTLVDPDESE